MKAFLLVVGLLWLLKIFALCRIPPGSRQPTWSAAELSVAIWLRVLLLAWAILLFIADLEQSTSLPN